MIFGLCTKWLLQYIAEINDENLIKERAFVKLLADY